MLGGLLVITLSVPSSRPACTYKTFPHLDPLLTEGYPRVAQVGEEGPVTAPALTRNEKIGAGFTARQTRRPLVVWHRHSNL
jgi:hypothetical protein